MEKLSLILHPKKFAVAFEAADGDIASVPTPRESVMWLEGGVGVAGRGFAWGHGQMDHRGVNYTFCVSSLSVADVDAVGIYAIGRVLQLSKIADFDGHYLASGARSAAAGGSRVTHLQNERGVVIQVVATDAARSTSRSIDALCLRIRPKMASQAA
jgi:hypothetical protein